MKSPRYLTNTGDSPAGQDSNLRTPIAVTTQVPITGASDGQPTPIPAENGYSTGSTTGASVRNTTTGGVAFSRTII